MKKIKKKRISDFTNFSVDFTKDFTDETPKDINLRNYLDEDDQREITLNELEKELKEKENEQNESIDNTDDVAQAAQYVKELLWEFGDEIRKEIEVDKYNNLSVLIRPKREPFNSLEDIKTGQAIRIGEDFVDRLASIYIMLNELGLVNVFEVIWTKITEKGNRTRKKTIIDQENLEETIKLIKDKPIAQVSITAGKPK